MSKDKIREIYEFFFKTADADGDGFVTGGEAAAMFRKSGISDELLRNIWAQVSQGQPHLNKSSFFMALGLIGLAQAGRDPKISDLGVGKMLAPTFAGITPPGSQLTLLQPEMLSSPSTSVPSSPSSLTSPLSPVMASGSASSLPSVAPAPSVPAPTSQTSSQVSPASIVWSVSDAQKVTSAQYFATLDVKNSGALGGAEAKDFFLKSELPAPELAVIWALSDVDGDGKLSLQEFQIAFFLTQQRRNKLDLPKSLPPSIFESVGLPVPTTVTLVSPVLTPGASAPNSKQGSMIEVHAHTAHESGNTFSPAPTANAAHPTGTPPHNNSSHATPNNASPAGSKSSSFGSMSDIHATPSPLPIASPIANLSTHLSGSLSKMPEIREEEELKSPTSSSAVSPAPVVTSAPVPLVPIASSRPANQDFRLTMQFDAATMKAMLEQEKAAAGGFQPLASGAPSSIPVHLQTTSSNADEWILTNDVKATYDSYFARADELGSGFVSGPRARELFTKASLPNAVLAEIWSLSDANNDGQLDRAEFALAMHLINLARRGIKPPAVLPYAMLESAGVNPKTLAEVRDKAAAKERAQKEAQVALEQQAAYEAALKRQEEERVEVGHMKAQIAQLLREKEAAVKSLRAQQTANVSLAQHLARADYEADTLRLDVSQMELQVEKAKIKGASVKEHSESMMRNLAAATEDKATLEALLQQRRTQYLTEAAALNALETQLADNRTALARQTQDIASLRASVAALQRAKDERASRAFDPQVLQQKLAQEKLRQDFAAARAASASSLAKSHASHQHSHPSNGNSDSATPTSAFETKPVAAVDAFAHSSTDDWVSFPASSSQNASSSSFGNVAQHARVYDDFGSVRGAATVAVPKSFGFEMEEDDFGKPAAASAAVAIENTAARAATPTTEMTSAVSPTAFANEPLSLADDFFIPSRPEKPLSPTTTEKDENAYPQPDDDFFAPSATGPSAFATFAPEGNTNPFPAFEEKNGESEVAATKGSAQTNAFGDVDDFAPLPNPAVHVYTSQDATESDKKDDASGDEHTKAAQLQDGPSISVAENTLEVQAPALNAVQQVQEESVSTHSAVASTNPFPASAAAADEGFASAFLSNNSSTASASFDDLFASVPAVSTTSEATPIMFGSTDDLFGPSGAGSSAAPVSSSTSDSSFRNAFDEKLFDD